MVRKVKCYKEMFIRMLCVKGKKTSKDWIRSENRRKLAHEQWHVLEI